MMGVFGSWQTTDGRRQKAESVEAGRAGQRQDSDDRNSGCERCKGLLVGQVTTEPGCASESTNTWKVQCTARLSTQVLRPTLFLCKLVRAMQVVQVVIVLRVLRESAQPQPQAHRYTRTSTAKSTVEYRSTRRMPYHPKSTAQANMHRASRPGECNPQRVRQTIRAKSTTDDSRNRGR